MNEEKRQEYNLRNRHIISVILDTEELTLQQRERAIRAMRTGKLYPEFNYDFSIVGRQVVKMQDQSI